MNWQDRSVNKFVSLSIFGVNLIMYLLKTLVVTRFLGNALLIVGLVIQNPRKGNAVDGFTCENGLREVDEIYVRPVGL